MEQTFRNELKETAATLETTMNKALTAFAAIEQHTTDKEIARRARLLIEAIRQYDAASTEAIKLLNNDNWD